MKQKLIQLDAETREVIIKFKIDGNRLTLPGQLARPLYVKVAKAIEAAGGKWNKKESCHLFPHPVKETFNVSEDTTCVVNVQQTYQAFYTPAEVANQVIQWAGIEPHHIVLEPSAGEGALIRAMPPCDKVAVEINPLAAKRLSGLAALILGDFMAMTVDQLGLFDRIVMNPPFTRGQDIKHIKHALEFLNINGRLVAICADGPKQAEILKPLAKHWIKVPAGAFKESGTEIATIIAVFTN